MKKASAETTPLKHVVLLFGEDSFQVHEKLTTWKRAFCEKYGGDVNVDEMEGSTLAPNELISLTQAIPFLSEKRLVIVKNFIENHPKESLKTFAELLEKIPESCTLILVETTPPDRRTALFKTLEQRCRLEECRPFTESQAVTWIQAQAERYGSRIDSKLAQKLHALMPKDTWKLAQEVQKLSLYAAPEPITEAMIDELTQGSVENSVFQLTDALGEQNAERAIHLLHDLIEQGEELPMILGMLARQVRLLIQIKDLQNHGIQQAPAIAERLKQHPYAIKILVQKSPRFTLEKLITLHGRLTAIDRNVKTGELRFSTADPLEYRLTLEQFLIEATTPSS